MASLITDIEQIPHVRLLRDDDGNIVDDVTILKEAIKMADDCKAKTGKPLQGVPPKFIEWAREAVDYCDKGGKITDYKAQTIVNTCGDYEVICENTRRKNEIAAKQGEFKITTEKKIIRG